jgi:hypothetical protein
VGPRAGLDGCGKSRPYRYSIPDRPAHSESHTSCVKYSGMAFGPVGAELFLVDGQTDMPKLVVAIRSTAKGTVGGISRLEEIRSIVH